MIGGIGGLVRGLTSPSEGIWVAFCAIAAAIALVFTKESLMLLVDNTQASQATVVLLREMQNSSVKENEKDTNSDS